MIVNHEHSSYFNPSIVITQQNWATTLICNSTRSRRQTPLSGSSHAVIVIEGVKESGKYFRKIVHLTGPDSTNETNTTVFRGSCCSMGMQRIGEVKISDITDKPNVFHTHKSPTWLRSAEKVRDLLHRAELEKNRPFEFPRPFSIFGNRSIFSNDLETFKITDPLIAAIANCDKKLFLKLYDRVKKCRDGAEPGITRLNENYFYPLEDEYPHYCGPGHPDGGYNIVTSVINNLWNDYVRPLTFGEKVIYEFERPPQWRSRISDNRVVEIMELFKEAQTSEERDRLIEHAPQLEKDFFTLAKERIERMLRLKKEELLDTGTILWWDGYGKRVNNLVTKIILKHSELEERVTNFKRAFNESPISSCCHLLLTIYNSTDLCILTPDSCFTWAREKLRLIDVEIEDTGMESCISPTKCYLTSVNSGCCN